MDVLRLGISRSLISGGLIFLLSGCQITYYVKSAYNQAKLLQARIPIKQALSDPSLNDATKRKLRLAQEARLFAETELGLKPTDNYTSFVQLDRPYVSWIVHASPVFELKHHLWSFPFVGSLPYKGFFTEDEANKEAAEFKSEKFDTYIRGVTAYSTLGWFDDPILSSMVRYQDHDLVNLIIHETVHSTLYIKSEADFNEQLATFIGNLGMEMFYRKLEGDDTSETLEKIASENADEKVFSNFISQEIDNLTQWYKDNQQRPDLDEKKRRLSEINQRFRKVALPKMKSDSYKTFADNEFNNAKLLSYKTYVHDLSDFEMLYAKLGKNFKALIEFCKTLEKAKNPKARLKEFINDPNAQ